MPSASSMFSVKGTIDVVSILSSSYPSALGLRSAQRATKTFLTWIQIGMRDLEISTIYLSLSVPALLCKTCLAA